LELLEANQRSAVQHDGIGGAQAQQRGSGFVRQLVEVAEQDDFLLSLIEFRQRFPNRRESLSPRNSALHNPADGGKRVPLVSWLLLFDSLGQQKLPQRIDAGPS